MISETAPTAPTRFLDVGNQRYAYRRFGKQTGLPLLCLQHFTGTLDNWDPALMDALAAGRELILFDNAGIGRSNGTVPTTVAGMATHALAFLDGLGLKTCDVLGFSLGGMVAQDMVRSRPSIFRRMILVGTAPRGGEDVMHLDKPSLAKPLSDPTLRGYAVLQKIFFAPTAASQAAGGAFVERLSQRKTDLDPPSGPNVAQAQMASFRDWEKFEGERFADLAGIRQQTLVVNGVHDEMIPVRNSYWLAEHLPNAMLVVYPDAGHGSLFQYHELFARQVADFLGSAAETKALVLKAFDTLFNQRDYAKAAEFWSPDYIQHSAHIEPGRDGLFNLVKSAPSTLRYENAVIVVEGDYVMLHGRFSGNGRPRAWIAGDVVRMENGRLAEHWDVLQDEVTAAESKSGLPMFGTSFALTVEDARRIVAPLYDALNEPGKKDVDALLAKAANPDYRSYSTNDEWLTRDQLAEVFKAMGAAIPDLRWTIQDIQVIGDQIIVRGEATGTPTGELFGAPPTGKGFKTISLDLFTVKNGKLASAYHVENWITALQQMSLTQGVVAV